MRAALKRGGVRRIVTNVTISLTIITKKHAFAHAILLQMRQYLHMVSFLDDLHSFTLDIYFDEKYKGLHSKVMEILNFLNIEPEIRIHVCIVYLLPNNLLNPHNCCKMKNIYMSCVPDVARSSHQYSVQWSIISLVLHKVKYFQPI